VPATRLTTRRIEKPWGRTNLYPGFGDVPDGGEPVGEIWFEAEGEEPELLIKYLFTSEKLSIQVHPNDEQAQERGYPRGKDEAWVVLDAEPHATIGLGLREATTQEHLREAALDGTIEDLVDWRSAKAGDVIYSPAGMVHALGPGLTLVEVQQNVDLTYRLYDYGRPRELHLDDGIAVSEPVPYVAANKARELSAGRIILCEGPKLVMERWSFTGEGALAGEPGRPIWLAPITDSGTIDGEPLQAGGVWIADGATPIALVPGADLLVSYTGGDVLEGLWQAA